MVIRDALPIQLGRGERGGPLGSDPYYETPALAFAHALTTEFTLAAEQHREVPLVRQHHIRQKRRHLAECGMAVCARARAFDNQSALARRVVRLIIAEVSYQRAVHP